MSYRKVAPVLKALGLTYEHVFLDLLKQEQKGAEHTQFNPNGRIPALVDHQNEDFTIWSVSPVASYAYAG